MSFGFVFVFAKEQPKYGHDVKIFVLDNECSSDLKLAILDTNSKYQLVKLGRSPIRKLLFQPYHTFAYVGRAPRAQTQKIQPANDRVGKCMKPTI